MTSRGLLILGFGGHARSVADVARDLGIEEMAFVDPNARPGDEFAGFPVFAAMPEPLPPGWTMFPAVGDNEVRQRQVEDATTRGLAMESLVSRRAYIGIEAIVLPASFIAHHAHVGPMAVIGRGAIINTGAVVDHESRIGDFTHIAVNATVAGRCNIGSLVFLGAGATVVDHINIVDRVIIGAGSTVIDDITEPGVYVGSPVRRVESR
jgi:UDP-N-acetylbacillosamine N-acetyltransferase